LAADHNNKILVLDVGGSHISAGLFNLRTAKLERWNCLPVLPAVSKDEFVTTVGTLADTLLPQQTLPEGIAVAIPNPFDYDRGISYMRHKYQQLYGQDLRQGLSQKLGCNPAGIHFLNDAAAFLIGELDQGAAVGVRRGVGITLGTGVGSAFTVAGQIAVRGPGIPPGGEIWNLPYRDGVVETFLSTSTIQREYARLTGMRAEVHEIAGFAREQPQARQTFKHFGQELGRVLRYTCAAFAPECIVLGGGISRAATEFLNQAENELADLAIQLRVSILFDHAALIGAGVSWRQKHTQREGSRNYTHNNFAEQA
jgi:predicted NBD/HSP70 family sugar kinase